MKSAPLVGREKDVIRHTFAALYPILNSLGGGRTPPSGRKGTAAKKQWSRIGSKGSECSVYYPGLGSQNGNPHYDGCPDNQQFTYKEQPCLNCGGGRHFT